MTVTSDTRPVQPSERMQKGVTIRHNCVFDEVSAIAATDGSVRPSVLSFGVLASDGQLAR